jgi:hypothetical protein
MDFIFGYLLISSQYRYNLYSTSKPRSLLLKLYKSYESFFSVGILHSLCRKQEINLEF